jgi:hypothetical protein
MEKMARFIKSSLDQLISYYFLATGSTTGVGAPVAIEGRLFGRKSFNEMVSVL